MIYNSILSLIAAALMLDAVFRDGDPYNIGLEKIRIIVEAMIAIALFCSISW